MAVLEREVDRVHEQVVAEKICKILKCEWGRLGAFAPIDFYFHRKGKMIVAAEIKVRDRNLADFNTVYIDLRKYLNLLMAEVFLAIPAVYVVSCDDGIYYIRIGRIAPGRFMDVDIKGRSDRPGVQQDIKPALPIPVDLFLKFEENHIKG